MSLLLDGDRYAFALERKVSSHDCDAAGRLKLSSALRYVEAASTGHLDALGLGHARLYSEGIVFVLVAQALKVYKLPQMYDRLKLKTCPAATQGVQMVRETVIYDERGEVMLESQASWVMINPVSRKPLRPSAFTYPLKILDDWSPFINPSKLKFDEADEPVMKRPVLYSDLDINNHLNNTIYSDIVMDAIPLSDALGKTPQALLLKLRHEATAGELLEISRSRIQSGYLVSAKSDKNICFEALLEIK